MSAPTFKKSSPNGHLTIYLGKRNYTIYDSIDGVILMDPVSLQDRKLFCRLVMDFRYGRKKDEILGLSFHKEFCLDSMQIYPPLEKHKFNHTELQDRLIKKLGPGKAYPFTFHLPNPAPVSVMLQSGERGDGSKPCGIHYFIKGFVADDETENVHRRNAVEFGIYNIQYTPRDFLIGQQPYASANRSLMICTGDIELEATLNKPESPDETSSYLRQSSSQLPSAPPSPPGGSCSDSVSLAISTSSRKSKKANSTMRRNEAIDAAMKALKEDDEFDGIGLNVACKLRRMNQDQQLYAEMLINKVLLNGMKERLQEETDVCALKFMRPLIPVRPTERQIFFDASVEVNDHIQTPPNNTNNSNPPSVGVAQCINQTDEDDPLSKYLIL